MFQNRKSCHFLQKSVQKCDRTSHVKNEPHARTSHAQFQIPFRTHFRTHMKRAEVRFYAHVRRNPTSAQFRPFTFHQFCFQILDLQFTFFLGFSLLQVVTIFVHQKIFYESRQFDKVFHLSSAIKNTQFSKQNRRKQTWARMRSKRCKIIKRKCSCCLR